MKTDADLKRDVVEELSWDPAVNATAIGVAVKEGVVTLAGHLDTLADKYAIERALHRVAGVKAIALELDVRLSPEHRRSDTEIAAAAEQALRWNSMVPAERVRVTVERGAITLGGEVDWDYQRQAAFKAVRHLIGVTAVRNDILIRSGKTRSDVAARIKDALARQAAREAARVEVDIAEGTVTLRGTVHSLAERKAVVGAAFAAPGVRAVVNDLTVG
ncbi:BON domain-containing protein [Caldimonas sp. KR1-144]|uniref:BON domain-containing protein n=1 Tax=Caldimonas sp. KR1-144 TaxID=3400911 RepID=UPI003C03C533